MSDFPCGRQIHPECVWDDIMSFFKEVMLLKKEHGTSCIYVYFLIPFRIVLLNYAIVPVSIFEIFCRCCDKQISLSAGN